MISWFILKCVNLNLLVDKLNWSIWIFFLIDLGKIEIYIVIVKISCVIFIFISWNIFYYMIYVIEKC